MLFPQPHTLEYIPGTYTTHLRACDSLFAFYREYVNDAQIDRHTDALLSPEEYILHIDDGGIHITHSSQEGLYRAMTTLYLLLNEHGETLPYCHIADHPDFPRRGYMLDVSRGRVPKMETLKALIDWLSVLKYNEFQLYFEGFAFYYEQLSEYMPQEEGYTPADIQELDLYCQARFIDLIPNQNCFGHMHEWLAHPGLSHLELRNDTEQSGTLNPLLPESQTLVERIFASLLPHFTSEYVNIGMDEAYGLGRFQIEEYCREKGNDTVFMDWLDKIHDITYGTYQKRPMFWADMITNYPDSFKRIPKGAIALEWGYDPIQTRQMAERCIAFRDKGIDYYVCPSCNTHFSHTGRFDATAFNLMGAGEIGKKYGAIGYLLTDWGMGYEGHPHFGIWSFLPAAIGGQYAWNTGEPQSGENMKAHYIRNAKAFTNEYLFAGENVAEQLYRAANYYLLEPERVHVGTICGQLLPFPLTTTNYFTLFDLKDFGDAFYFDTVIWYMNRVIADIEALHMDARYKREMLLNCKSVVLSAELCKLRLHPVIAEEKRQELIALVDDLQAEFPKLWRYRNYEAGMDIFMGVLRDRRDDLLKL